MINVTLTTDLGLRDYYVASLKGALLKEIPNLNIVDISHAIPPFDIARAAFNIRNCYPDFPEGTVHIIGVQPEASLNVPHVVVKHKGHYFIGADNGIFSLLFEEYPDEVFELTITQDSDRLTFPTRDVFVKVAAHIARGGTMEVIGKVAELQNHKEMFRPVVEQDVIRGAVIYIDHYGNITTNISESLFKNVGRGRPFRLIFRSEKYTIKEIHKAYNAVSEGEKLALFNAGGLLEIAINRGVEGSGGGADKLFGLKLSDMVRLEFSDKPAELF